MIHIILAVLLAFIAPLCNANDGTDIPETSIASSFSKKKLSVRDKRLHKRSSKRITMRDMTYEQLDEQKKIKLKNNELELAIRYVEKMLPLCKDMHEQGKLQLEHADLNFAAGHIEKAGKGYNEFIKLNPGNADIEPAYKRAADCSFALISPPTKDQSKTKETLELTKQFLVRFGNDSSDAKHVKEIQDKCYEVLAKSELSIADFYLNRPNPNFKAAQNRLNTVKDEMLKASGLEQQVIVKEIEIAKAQHNVELATIKLAELEQKFPESQRTVLAQAKPKRSFIDVF